MSISFKVFLESARGNFKREELSVAQAVTLIQQNSKGWLAYVKRTGQCPLFRGDNNSTHLSISLGDSNDFIRTAANTNNWYALWIDNSPKWKDFPRRLNSYICTTSIITAGGYGSTFIVIPFDTANIGMVPSDDMWGGFSKALPPAVGEISDVATLQSSISSASLYLGVDISESDITELRRDLSAISVDAISSVTNKIQKEFSKWYLNKKIPYSFDEVFTPTFVQASYDRLYRLTKENAEFNKEIASILGNSNRSLSMVHSLYQSAEHLKNLMTAFNVKNAAQLYDAIFDPDINGFTHLSASKLPSFNIDSDSNVECWVQGKCIFVNVDDNNSDFLEQVSKLIKRDISIYG